MKIRFDILTLFPEAFSSYFGSSILKRAQAKKKLAIKLHDFRKFTSDKHNKVDDKPYGGGPGMVLKVEPIDQCLKSIRRTKKSRVILLTPQGKQFDQPTAKRLAKYSQLILVCGHYEGFDERVRALADEQVSIGPYVLTGGEPAAMIMVDAISRLVPGVLGHEESASDETFSKGNDYVEYPQYTRPADYKGKKVPAILFSGDHAKIAAWRREQSKKRAKK